MHPFQFFTTIYKENWLIDPVFSIAQGPLIASILNKTQLFESGKPDPLSAYAILASQPETKYSSEDGFKNAPDKSVAVIAIKGVLMKDDMYCGPIGTASMGAYIQAADKNPNISSIVLVIDSPGGTVDGTEALANIVKKTKKPCVTYVDGLMASAAFWIGSSANEIISSTDTDQIGSVGVVMRFTDLQPVWEKEGAVFHSITASTSPDKTKMFDELRAGNYENYRKEILDPLDQKFMNAIRENLPGTEEKHLTGKVFFARDVMGVFVSSIGTLDHAISRAHQLSLTNEANENNTFKINSSMKQFTKINAVLGIEALETVDETVSLNEPQLELIEQVLFENDQNVIDARAKAETERDQAIQDLQAATADYNQLLASIDAINPDIANATSPELKAEAIRAILSSKPGMIPAGIQESTDDENQPDIIDWETIDKLPHNVLVDQNL